MNELALLNFITDFGDSALLVPASVIFWAYLLYLRRTRAAATWISTLALCVGVTMALKIAIHTCGMSSEWAELRSPSGHTSLGTTFYCCGALIVAQGRDIRVKLLVIAAAIFIVAGIAITRIALHAHTPIEVLAGLSIGIICAMWCGFRGYTAPQVELPWPPLLAALAVVWILTYGSHWKFETMIAQIAGLFRSHIAACH